jgi:hypothetical protein
MARNASFDFVRSLAMMLIVRFHLTLRGLKNVVRGTRTATIWNCADVWFSTAVDSMAAISGYFGVTSTRLNIFRLITIQVEIWLYVYLGCCLATKLGWIDRQEPFYYYLIRTPVLTGAYWYASAYLIVAWISPGLNYMARSLTQFQYILVIIVLLVIEIDSCREERQGRVHPIFPLRDGYSASHLAILYFIAGYFRLHSRILPQFVIRILYLLTFKVQYNLVDDFWPPFQWMQNHGLGPFTCHFKKRIWGLPLQTNIVTLALTFLNLLVADGIHITGSFGTAVTFVGSFSFAAYLIQEHYALSWNYGPLFRHKEMISTPEIALVNGFLFPSTLFFFTEMIDIYRHYLWETLSAIVHARICSLIRFVQEGARGRKRSIGAFLSSRTRRSAISHQKPTRLLPNVPLNPFDSQFPDAKVR